MKLICSLIRETKFSLTLLCLISFYSKCFTKTEFREELSQFSNLLTQGHLPKSKNTHIKSKPMSLADSLITTENIGKISIKTTTSNWVSHTPIPAEWLQPDSEFNELGILKVRDKTREVPEFKPQEGLVMFRKKAKSLPIQQRLKFIEMGLNSDNPAIFDYSLQSITNERHHAAVDILSKLLKQKKNTDESYAKIYKTYRQLIFYSLAIHQKIAYLQRIFIEDDPVTNEELFLWAVEEFGDIADIKYYDSLTILEKYPALNKQISLTKIKLKLNSNFKDHLDRFIQATLDSEPMIRNWGLDNIKQNNSPKAARFLLLLYEQTNISHGLLEFGKIRDALEFHQSKFPSLYATLLPEVNELQNVELAN